MQENVGGNVERTSPVRKAPLKANPDFSPMGVPPVAEGPGTKRKAPALADDEGATSSAATAGPKRARAGPRGHGAKAAAAAAAMPRGPGTLQKRSTRARPGARTGRRKQDAAPEDCAESSCGGSDSSAGEA